MVAQQCESTLMFCELEMFVHFVSYTSYHGKKKKSFVLYRIHLTTIKKKSLKVTLSNINS